MNIKIRKIKIETKNGVIKTPFFMPDATRGFVKFLSNTDLKSANISPMVVNTYHLYLQPGIDSIKKAGGIHKFMNWDGPLLSDSGGYQVFSLIHKNPKMGKIDDSKVIFRSPLDGSRHEITPEKSIQIQFDLGVDMMVCLDDPPPNHYSRQKIEKAVERTIAWAKRCKNEYERQIKKRKLREKNKPLIFGVIQGGEHIDLREHCAKELVKIGFDGYGFGARHIDDEGNFLKEVLQKTASFIPKDSLRFALGVGSPEDIVRCVEMGWDMFDCVIPTREGRHGRLFVFDEKYLKNKSFLGDKLKKALKFKQSQSNFYNTININNGKYEKDFSPIDKNCDCELCKNHTKAYLKNLFKYKDPSGMRLAAIHNLNFYSKLMQKIGE